MEPIAIIGAAHRFPGGANTPSKLWALLTSTSADLSRPPQASRLNLQKFHHADGIHHGSTSVSTSYFLDEDPGLFDAAFFGISPLEAEAMDPQHRLLLETVYEASEAAGVALHGSATSVFVGAMTGDYADIQARDSEDISNYTASGTSRALLANRISHCFDLSGASLCLDTACSSSLVALHLAVQDLRNGTSSMAVVAGCNLIFGVDMYVAESKLHMLSPTGQSRFGDISADGYARGEGIAAVLLKPLRAAIKDGDAIQAVIRNSGVNSDGRTPGITMPSATAQAALIRQTYSLAGLDPTRAEDRCQYFEAHGTGTQAGDPTEVEGIAKSFFTAAQISTSQQQVQSAGDARLLVGSVKTVMGHLEGCAGLAGVMKVLVALKHGAIPPNTHLKTLNPKIAPYAHLIDITTKTVPWPDPPLGQPRRASVNSFGFGGTNAHVILESFQGDYQSPEQPEKHGHEHAKDGTYSLPLVLSANEQSSLVEQVSKVATYLNSNPSTSLDDICWTAWTRRSELALKASFRASSRHKLIADLETAVTVASESTKNLSIGVPARLLVSPREGFGALGIFTGQGAQWPGMGHDLYRHNPVFRRTIAACDEALAALPKADAPSWTLRELLADESSSRIGDAEIAQPATTAVEIALVDVLVAAGIRFAAVVGHSSGEIAAAYAAGILSLSDAIRVAFYRGLHATRLTGAGAMMAVGIGSDAAVELCERPQFHGRLALAARNSAASVTLSGDIDAIDEAKAIFDADGVFARVLRTEKAYHSHHMVACGDAYLSSLQECNIKPQTPPFSSGGPNNPKCVWVSSVDGTADRWWNGDFSELSGQYWVDNMVKPVLFADAVTAALTNGGPFDVAIEVGPHPALKLPVQTTMQAHLGGSSVPYVGCMHRGQDCVDSLAQLVGFLWCHFGSSVVNFEACRRRWSNISATPKIVTDLPAYSWNHSRSFFRESRISRQHRLRAGDREGLLLGHRCADDSDWEPRWRNFLSLDELPWLRGHAFQGDVLFPAAGYVVIALEIALFLARGRPLVSIEISNLTFERSLSVHDGPRSVELITSCRVVNAGKGLGPADDGTLTAAFSCCMCNDPTVAAVDRTCFGDLVLQFGNEHQPLLPQRVAPVLATGSVNVDRFYASVQATGLEYAQHFRGLSKIARARGMATASASWDASQVEFGSLPHPAVLDTALQTLFAAYAAPTTDKLWTAYLPQAIERILVDPNQLHVFSESQLLSSRERDTVEMTIDTHITAEQPGSKITGDLDIFSGRPLDPIPPQPVMQLQGLALAALKRPSPADDRLIFSQEKWQPDLLGGASFPIAANDPPQKPMVRAAERVSLFYAQKIIAAAETVGGVTRLKPHEQLFVAELQRIVATVHDDTHELCERAWLADAPETIDSLMRAHSHQVDFELVARVGMEIGAVFRGEKPIVEVLFRDDKLGDFYRGGLGTRNGQRQVAEYMRAIAHRYPKARILEVGSGTGATTAAVFDAIGHDYGSYTFTDVSAGFFGEAQQRFSDHADKMEFRMLDIGALFTDQGFEIGEYDVVIAANVLHISEHITDVLQRVRGLLKPGGLLVATEPTSALLRLHILFGGLEGWWLAKDGCRFSGPSLSIETWDEKLRETGFAGVDVFAHDQDEDVLRTTTTFVSQAVSEDMECIREPTKSMHLLPSSTQFLILGGASLQTSKLVRSLKAQLEARGHKTVHFPEIRSLRWPLAGDGCEFEPYVLCLAELDQPIFRQGLDAVMLRQLQLVAAKSAGVQVYTRDSASSNPFSNMMLGFCRALRSERPSCPLQTIDIDEATWTRLNGQMLADHFLRFVFGHVSVSVIAGECDDRLYSFETELAVRDANVVIPRIRPCSELNDRLNSRRRAITAKPEADRDILEVTASSGKMELVATCRTGSQACPGNLRIEVDMSTLLPMGPSQFQNIVYGRLQNSDSDSTPAVLAVTDKLASVIDVPVKQVFSLPDATTVSANTLATMAEFLMAHAWVLVTPRGGCIWLHGVEESLGNAFETVAKSQDVRVFRTSTEPHATDYLHHNASLHQIKCRIPDDGGINTLVVGDALQKSLQRLQRAAGLSMTACGSVNTVPTARSEDKTPSEALLSEAFAFASNSESSPSITETGTEKAVQLVSLADVENLRSESGLQRIVAWAGQFPARARIMPFDASQLFKADRSYLMVGMTSDLGLSICAWMIQHGARHIVLASRQPEISPHWLAAMACKGANIVVKPIDVTSCDSVCLVVADVERTMPALAGVCNGAMVLSDGLLATLDADAINAVLRPKIDGSVNLDKALAQSSSPPLDFFVMLSSVNSVIGALGQAPYHMANMFQVALAANRRQRGLAGSTVDVGMVGDVGYVTRQAQSVERNLRAMNLLALCEDEVHVLFAEGILAGRPELQRHSEVMAGLGLSDDEDQRPFWAGEARFAFYVMDKPRGNPSEDENSGGKSSAADDLQTALKTSDDENFVAAKIKDALAKRLERLLQLPAHTLNMSLPLVNLGMDSLLGMEMQSWFKKVVGADISLLQILGGASGEGLCQAAAKSAIKNFDGVRVKPASASASASKAPKHTAPAVKKSVFAKPPPSPPSSTSSSAILTPSSNTSASMSATTPPALSVPNADSPTTTKTTNRIMRTCPISQAQARIWFVLELLEDPTTYNETVMYTLRGPLDIARLEAAFHQLTAHHDIFRTRFCPDPITDQPMQTVMEACACPFQYIPQADQRAAMVEFEAFKKTAWDLGNGVSMGLTVLRHSATEHTFILGMQHIVCDGMTWVIVLRDLAKAYQGQRLTPVPQYIDYCISQQNLLTTHESELAQDLSYWKTELAGVPQAMPLLPMARVKQRPAALSRYDMHIVDTTLTKNLVARMKAICGPLGITPFHFHLSALIALITRLSSTSDMCVGVVDAGRHDIKWANTSGFFVNMVPVRVSVSPGSFRDLCKTTSQKTLAALSHAHVPLDTMLDALRVPRSARHSPLFQVAINYRLGIMAQNTIGDCELNYVDSRSSSNAYDLDLSISETPDGTCHLHLAVQGALYSEDAGRSLLASYCRLLEAACQNPATPLSDWEFLAPEPEEQPVSEPGAGAAQINLHCRGERVEYDWEDTLSRQIAKMAREYEASPAVKDSQGTYTYSELMKRVDNVAAALMEMGCIGIRGGEPFKDVRFVVLVDPSVDYCVALLAILKVGGVAVSMDPGNHRDRLGAMVEDCQPMAILHHMHTLELAQYLAGDSLSLLDVSRIIPLPSSFSLVADMSSPSDAAFLVYTSGTTGAPKGALLTNANYRAGIAAMARVIGPTTGREVFLQQTPVTFDLVFIQLFTCLASAGTLVMVSKEQRGDPSALAELMVEHQVTFLSGTPTEISTLLHHASTRVKQCTSLRHLFLGGEVLPKQVAAQLISELGLAHLIVYHGYGLAETAMANNLGRFTASEILNMEIETPIIHAGPTLANYSTYVLDEEQRPLGVGKAGEIFIGGVGVGCGYLNRPQATIDRYLMDPFATAQDIAKGWRTMYRTGDRGYIQADGSLVILGRIGGDTQVKIRGVRIELDDVAANVVNHSRGAVVRAAVATRGEGEEAFLVAFVVLSKMAANLQAAEAGEQQAFLDEIVKTLPLPSYMRPVAVVPLEQLPCTANGKLDRRALNTIPIPDRRTRAPDSTCSEDNLAPLERDLYTLWLSLVPTGAQSSANSISPESDFFAEGGNSMLLVRVRKAIQRQWNVELPLIKLFERSTLADMAEMIRGMKDEQSRGSDWGFWDQETKFDLDTQPGVVPGPAMSPKISRPGTAKTILLTGANLHFGSKLLQYLVAREDVAKVHCVAVPSAQQVKLAPNEKLEIHEGSLGMPGLGLSTATLERFRHEVNLIIHAGAEGSCLNTYASIKAPNVGATKSLVYDLALPAVIPLHYVSTARTILFSGENAWPAQSVAHFYPPDQEGREGFTSTKWASERFLEGYSGATGHAVTIHRPGYMTAADADEMDAVNMILKYTPVLGALPDLHNFVGWLELCDMDHVAQRLVATVMLEGELDQVLALDGAAAEDGRLAVARVVHYTQENAVPVEDFKGYVEDSIGCGLQVLPMQEWAQRAEEAGMSPILAEFLVAVVQKEKEARYPRLL